MDSQEKGKNQSILIELIAKSRESGIIYSKDQNSGRVFISTQERIDKWNYYQDLLIIDSTHKFKYVIVRITADSHGGNYLLAFALTKTESEYKWAFERFKTLGFKNPKTIVIDRLAAQKIILRI